MDCCNYMQYRHHQPYYGSQYYHDPIPSYHGDFYGQQMYPDYYGNSPYYTQQQWSCAASFPDYVYCPKEARIRKAMRDATRERSMGVPPMLPRPNARRLPHNWVTPHDELMMSPLVGMRTAMESSTVCNFSLPTTSRPNQFISPPSMNGYNKLEPTMSATVNSVHNNYMQPNPLTQLQQHTEMWSTDYQMMRPRGSGEQFMMHEHVPSYQQQISNNLVMNNSNNNNITNNNKKSTNNNSPTLPTSPPANIANENVPPDNELNKTNYDGNNKCNNILNDGNEGGNSIENNNSENFINLFERQRNDLNNKFEKNDERKVKKPIINQTITNNNKKSSNKPLPDFNEAFGSTERGRFQSPPDPRLVPNKGYLDYFFDNQNQIKFDDYQI